MEWGCNVHLVAAPSHLRSQDCRVQPSERQLRYRQQPRSRALPFGVCFLYIRDEPSLRHCEGVCLRWRSAPRAAPTLAPTAAPRRQPQNFFPTIPIYPSFSLESIMGTFSGQACSGIVAGAGATPPPALAACIAANYNTVAGMKRDAFAVTVRPLNALVDGSNGGTPWQREWGCPVRVSGRQRQANGAASKHVHPSVSPVTQCGTSRSCWTFSPPRTRLR